MDTTLLSQTVDELRFDLENIWQTVNSRPHDNNTQVVIPVSLETLNQVTDRAIIRTLDALLRILNRTEFKAYEVPSISRASASKMLNKTPKTLREWERKGILRPTYIEGHPYYRQSELSSITAKKKSHGKQNQQ